MLKLVCHKGRGKKCQIECIMPHGTFIDIMRCVQHCSPSREQEIKMKVRIENEAKYKKWVKTNEKRKAKGLDEKPEPHMHHIPDKAESKARAQVNKKQKAKRAPLCLVYSLYIYIYIYIYIFYSFLKEPAPSGLLGIEANSSATTLSLCSIYTKFASLGVLGVGSTSSMHLSVTMTF